MTFDFHFEATLYNGVTGQFGKGALGELVYLYTVMQREISLVRSCANLT